MYTFKARCTGSNQLPNGSHVATFQASTGEEIVIPSTDLLFEPGTEYSFSVDGKFRPVTKAAPAPKPVAPVAPAAAPKPPAPPAAAAPKPPAPPAPTAPKPVVPPKP